MLWILEQNLGLRAVCLCLDHDEAGIEASGLLADILHERGYDNVGMLQPEYKDWNEDLKAGRELPAQEAEEHPQLIASSEVCGRIGVCMDECVILDCLVRDLTNALCGYEMNLHRDYPEGAMTCIELASALALYAYGRGLRQLGEPHTREELLAELRSCIRPHQNRSSLSSRTAALAEQTHNVLKLTSRPGIRSEAEKRELTEGWLELALSCAKISVKYEADISKQQQKQTPPDRSPAERVRSGEEAQRNE